MNTYLIKDLTVACEVTSEVLRKAVSATGLQGRSKVKTKADRLAFLVSAGVVSITVENGEVSIAYPENDLTLEEVEEVVTKDVVALTPEANMNVFMNLVNQQAALEETMKQDEKQDDEFYFASSLKKAIHTVQDLLLVIGTYDKHLNVEMTDLMLKALNLYGEQGPEKALRALQGYTVENKKGVQVRPFSKIIAHVLANFSLGRRFVLGKRDTIVRPKVSLKSSGLSGSNISWFKETEQRAASIKEVLDTLANAGQTDDARQAEYDELVKQLKETKIVFNGGTKQQLIDGSVNFTTTSESSFTRCSEVEVQEIKLVKEETYTHPLTGVVSVLEYPITRRVTYDLIDIQYVARQANTELLLNNIKHNGFDITNVYGHEGTIHTEYLLATISKQRTMGATYCKKKEGYGRFATARAIHDACGTNFIAFATEKHKDGKTVYALKGEQRFKRAGLEAASTINVPTIRFGNDVKYYESGTWNEITREEGEEKGVYDYVLHGGTHTLRVIKIEVKSVVREGEYLAYNKEEEQIYKLDASVPAYEQKFIANDGANVYFSDSIRNQVSSFVGMDATLIQLRFANSGKGMAMYMNKGERITDLGDVVTLENNTKGNLELSAKRGHKLGLSIANFAKNPKDNEMFELPYQFQSTYSELSAEGYMTLFRRAIEKVEHALTDVDAAMELIGANLDNFNDTFNNLEESGLSEEEIKDAMADRDFTTVLKEAMLKSQKQAFNDAYIKKQLIRFIDKLAGKWMTGGLPVQGAYKFSLQDPLAVLDTLYGYWDGEIEGYEGEDGFTLDIPSHIGTIGAGQALVTVKGEYVSNDVVVNDSVMPYEGKAVFHRNPQYADLEVAHAVCVTSERYEALIAAGGLNNAILYSHYDFNLIRQGRQDCDGDRSAFTTEPILVDYVSQRFDTFPALLDLTISFDKENKPSFVEGCPYANPITNDDVPQIPTHLILSQDKFKVTFTEEQYENPELHEWLTTVEIAWALRNLQQNEIGLLTDSTTLHVDTNTLIANCLAQGKNRFGVSFQSLEQRVSNGMKVNDDQRGGFYAAQHAENLMKTRKLRYAGGWEIDLPKKGGAYKVALRETFLDFYFLEEKMTPIMSFEGPKGKRIQMKPLWFKLKKSCTTGEDVLNGFNEYYWNDGDVEKCEKRRNNHVKSTMDMFLILAVTEYQRLQNQMQLFQQGQNHSYDLLSSISYDTTNAQAIQAILENARKFFNETSKNLMDHYNGEIQKIRDTGSLSAKEKIELIQEVNKARSKAYGENLAFVEAVLANDDVIKNADPVSVGYYAYCIANKDGKSSSSFAWTVAWKFFAQTLEKCATPAAKENRQWSTKAMTKSDNLGGRKATRFSFVVPIESGFTSEQVARTLSVYAQQGKTTVKIERKKKNNTLYVSAFSPKINDYIAVGKIVYKEMIQMFNGVNEAYLEFEAGRISSNGKDTVTIYATSIKTK